MATENEIEQALSILQATYPNFKTTEDMIGAYFFILADVPGDLLALTVKAAIASCTFFPTPAELLKTLAMLMERGAEQPTAIEAWGNVVEEIHRVGYNKTPTFKNDITARVVKAMGWRYLCLSEEIMADRAHFIRAYESIARAVADDNRFKFVSGTRPDEIRQLTLGLSQSLLAPSYPELRPIEKTEEE